jgi:hypothetical protein
VRYALRAVFIFFKLKKYLFIPLLVYCTTVSAQSFFRFRADFSIKEKMSGASQGQLVTGTLFYDKNVQKINHQVAFPARGNWLVVDTLLYECSADSLLSVQTIAPYSQFSIYRLILDQQMSDFGLSKNGYTMTSVTGDSTGTTAVWSPPNRMKDQLGKIVVYSKSKQVEGIAFFDAKSVLRAKFYLKDYTIVEDLAIPSKIIQIVYTEADNQEYLRIIQFSHIIIDENGSDDQYNPQLPAARRNK